MRVRPLSLVRLQEHWSSRRSGSARPPRSAAGPGEVPRRVADARGRRRRSAATARLSGRLAELAEMPVAVHQRRRPDPVSRPATPPVGQLGQLPAGRRVRGSRSRCINGAPAAVAASRARRVRVAPASPCSRASSTARLVPRARIPACGTTVSTRGQRVRHRRADRAAAPRSSGDQQRTRLRSDAEPGRQRLGSVPGRCSL